MTESEAVWLGMLIGNLIGSGVGGHALRLVSLGPGLTSRHYIAWAGVLLYSICTVLVILQLSSGLVLTAFGPIVGLSATWLTKNKPDAFQLVLGMYQMVSVVIAVGLLLLRVLNHLE